MKNKWILLVLLLLVVVAWKVWPMESWKVDETGKLSYPKERGEVVFERLYFNSSQLWTQEKVVFEDKGQKIYGFLFTPKGSGKFPGVVLLPGGGVDKKGEENLAKTIAGWGYVVLTIDQRGVGETDGPFPPLEDDYRAFAEGREPVQHLVIYDALRSFDLVGNLAEADKSKVFLVGESMGGRIAIVAAALEKRVKGVIVFSAAGFHVSSADKNQERFLRSIDPDTYVQLVSPRQLVMFHAQNDTIVPIEEGKVTFAKAGQPKEWIEFPPCGHGYCEKMKEKLKEVLTELSSS